MAVTIFSKSWGRKEFAQVTTYKNISVCLRSFSMHRTYDFDVDGWSVCIAWLQVSWGTFSNPRPPLSSE